MEQKHHFRGLTDAEVLESRKKHGANVLTPREEESAWQKIKDCMHFWLLKFDLAIFMLTLLASIILPVTGIYSHEGLWIAPVLAIILFLLTYLVAYLGGDWNEEDEEFEIDSLFAILLFALLLSGAISFYNGVIATSSIAWNEFFEPIGIAVAVLLATTVAHILEAQNEKTLDRKSVV